VRTARSAKLQPAADADADVDAGTVTHRALAGVGAAIGRQN